MKEKESSATFCIRTLCLEKKFKKENWNYGREIRRKKGFTHLMMTSPAGSIDLTCPFHFVCHLVVNLVVLFLYI